MVGGSFLRQLERDRDRGRQGRENGQRAMLWTDGQRGEHVEREPFPVKGSVRCCTTYDGGYGGGALLLGKSNLAPVGCRQ